MIVDPRHKNEMLDAHSVDTYKNSYAEKFKSTLERVDSENIQKIIEEINSAVSRGNRIYVAGNGGSAAIADHLCCDWTKGTSCVGYPNIVSHSLSANVALYSAIANDYGFERVFSAQVGFFGRPGDVLIAISSSGNSQNIIEAVKAARLSEMFVVGFSGFKGGQLAELCDVSIHAAIDNYGIVEDVHQAVMHIIAQYIAYHRDNG